MNCWRLLMFPENIDGRETSLIESAAFAAGFLEVILFFNRARMLLFGHGFLDMIKLELHRKSVNFQICLNG